MQVSALTFQCTGGFTVVGVDYDLAIIGSGGAAFAAAIRASTLGSRAVVIERGQVGGTCVNIGCVPSKTLLAAADTLHRAERHPFAGIPTSTGIPDVAAVIGQKDELVAGLRQAKYVDLAESYGFEVVSGTATFAGPDVLDVDGTTMTAGAALVATGADPAVPALPGLADVGYLTSTTAMQQHEVPARLAVIGGGFVGMEQGQLFARLGSSVTIVGRLAPRAEPEVADWLRRAFTDDGITVVEERAVAVEPDGRGIVVVTDGGRRVAADTVLVAVGRAPRTAGLGLDAVGVAVDARGFVRVDAQQRTTNPHVYAAGDVTGGPQFVYVAAAQGTVAAESALMGSRRTMDYIGLPSVVFTSPSVASAGMTEAEALAAGHTVDSRVVELSDVPRAIVNRDTRGGIKLVADAQTGKVLGVHAVADHAGEVMLAATYAIKFGLTVDDLAATWAPYLTMSESLKLVAQSFKADVKRLSCCAA